jgi:hypothetical protein
VTLLTAMQEVQRECSLTVTAAVAADGQETQNLLLRLANKEAREVTRRKDWPQLTRTQSFTASLASLQASGKASDFARSIPDTFWNRSTDRQIAGPLNAQEWALAFGQPVTSTIQQHAMFRYDGLHIFPAPTVADTIAYEYIINTPVLAADGTTYKTAFTADTDNYVLDEEMLILGVVWRYLKTKGRDYAEALKDYEMRVESEINASRGARTLMVAPPDFEPLSHPLVPETGFTGAP